MSTYDYTSQIYALQNARGDMQAAKARNRAEITARYKAKIDLEIKQADRSAELEFARLLREANESGVPQSLIRSEVLRTNVWSRWTYWRDLAEIEPERKIMSDAKAQRDKYKAPYRWDDDQYDVLWWQHDRKGKPMDEPIRLEVDNKDRPGSPLVTREHMALVKEHHGNYNDFLRKTAAPVIFERFPIPTEDN